MSDNLPVLADGLETGLEDFEGGIQLPRLVLKHADRVFLDSATNEEYPYLVGIPLGLVRQRVMWSPDMGEDKGRPQCKSSDAVDGYPNVKDVGTDDEFPWDEFPISMEQTTKDEYDRPVLKCNGCPFAEWTKDKKGKPKPPLCKERYTFPFLYTTNRNPDQSFNTQGPFDAAGVFSLQGSGIKPARTYMSRFAASKMPLYSAIAQITLRGEERGSVKYSVPEFKKLDNTDPSDWYTYSEQLVQVREYLKAPPRPESDLSDAKPEGYVAPEPVKQATPSSPARTAPAAAPPPVKRADDVVEGTIVSESNVPSAPVVEDDLPF